MHGEMSNRIRAWAESKYVDPARRAGRRTFTIPVREVLDTLVEREGLPRQNAPQICQALRSPRKFLAPLGLEIEKIEGPEKQTSTTVVYHYRFQNDVAGAAKSVESSAPSSTADGGAPPASPIDRIYGLLKDELAQYGGGEAFLKWLRTDPEKDRR